MNKEDRMHEMMTRLRLTRELSSKEYSKLTKTEKELGRDLSNEEIAKMFNFIKTNEQ